MKKFIFSVFTSILAFILLLSAVSCARKPENPQKDEDKDAETITFTDSLGREVTTVKNPQKVAVLFSSFADVWTLAGGKIHVTVGESITRGFASEGTILVDDGAGKTINAELLIQSKPDFVIASADLSAQVKLQETLEKANIPLALFRVESFADYLNMLKICTDITGNETSYKENGTDIKAKIDLLLSKYKDANEEDAKKILFIRAGSSAKSTKAKTAKEHFACEMLNELNTKNIAENAPILLDGLSIEEILLQDPEYIFITTMGNFDAAKENMDSILQSEAWQSLSAVKNKKFFYLPKDLFQYKPNAKWLESYELLEDILYGNEK